MHVAHGTGVSLDPPADVLLTNPVSFIVQKLLIHDRRRPDKRAQDLLYIHDTLELFARRLSPETLRGAGEYGLEQILGD